MSNAEITNIRLRYQLTVDGENTPHGMLVSDIEHLIDEIDKHLVPELDTEYQNRVNFVRGSIASYRSGKIMIERDGLLHYIGVLLEVISTFDKVKQAADLEPIPSPDEIVSNDTLYMESREHIRTIEYLMNGGMKASEVTASFHLGVAIGALNNLLKGYRSLLIERSAIIRYQEPVKFEIRLPKEAQEAQDRYQALLNKAKLAHDRVMVAVRTYGSLTQIERRTESRGAEAFTEVEAANFQYKEACIALVNHLLGINDGT